MAGWTGSVVTVALLVTLAGCACPTKAIGRTTVEGLYERMPQDGTYDGWELQTVAWNSNARQLLRDLDVKIWVFQNGTVTFEAKASSDRQADRLWEEAFSSIGVATPPPPTSYLIGDNLCG